MFEDLFYRINREDKETNIIKRLIGTRNILILSYLLIFIILVLWLSQNLNIFIKIILFIFVLIIIL